MLLKSQCCLHLNNAGKCQSHEDSASSLTSESDVSEPPALANIINIGNLPCSVTEEDIRNLMEPFSKLLSATFVPSRKGLVARVR